ncbi:MAG: DUF2062 domain-containing protein [Nanoarchaeota archaeon]|nr:DUF2062 domain-containing protein [Nanoarchaeota archaeon]
MNLKKHFKEVMEIKTSPHSIATGFALGTLIAILPTFGLGILIGLLIIWIFKRISKISMLVAFAIWNPLVLAILYPLEYSVGNFFMPTLPITKFKIQILNQLFIYTARFLLGSLVLSITASILSYILVLLLVKKYQKQKLKSLTTELKEAKKVLKI